MQMQIQIQKQVSKDKAKSVWSVWEFYALADHRWPVRHSLKWISIVTRIVTRSVVGYNCVTLFYSYKYNTFTFLHRAALQLFYVLPYFLQQLVKWYHGQTVLKWSNSPTYSRLWSLTHKPAMPWQCTLYSPNTDTNTNTNRVDVLYFL